MNKLKALSMIMILSLSLSACKAGAPEVSPEEAVNQAVEGLYDVYSGQYELSMTGEATMQDVAGEEKVNFDVLLSGIFNMRDENNPNFSAKIEGSADVNDGSGPQEFELEMRVNKSSLYGLVSSVPDLGEEVPSDLVNGFVGKWYNIPLPPEAFDDVKFAPNGEEEDLTEEEKAMRDLINDTKFFKDISFVGNESVKGDDTYRYSAVLDEEAIKTFVSKASEIEGTRISDQELADLERALNQGDFEIDMWVSADDFEMRRMKGSMTLVDPQAQSNAQISFDLTLWDFNEDLNIDVPAESTEFDPMMFLGAAMMMQGGAEGELNLNTDIEIPQIPNTPGVEGNVDIESYL